MQAVEFQTTVTNGAIQVPDALKSQVAGEVRVIVLTEDHRRVTNGNSLNDPLNELATLADLTAAERGAQMRHEAALNQDRIAAGWAAAMREMGISGEPVGAEKLQAMMLAEGLDPNDNQFSRGIIEMREE